MVSMMDLVQLLKLGRVMCFRFKMGNIGQPPGNDPFACERIPQTD